MDKIQKNLSTDVDISKYNFDFHANNYESNNLLQDYYLNNYKWYILKLIWYCPKELVVTDYIKLFKFIDNLSENIYTDYAHHPVEIAATIDMAKELNQNIVVVYQPHQNIRQHEIIKEDAYRHCFDNAKLVYWLPTYLSREDPNLEVLSPTELMITTSPLTKTEYSEMNDALWNKILSHQKNGDLVLCMSAGDLDPWLRNKITNN